jgi:hypothetical protein
MYSVNVELSLICPYCIEELLSRKQLLLKDEM